jgi:hypothetical protein
MGRLEKQANKITEINDNRVERAIGIVGVAPVETKPHVGGAKRKTGTGNGNAYQGRKRRDAQRPLVRI